MKSDKTIPAVDAAKRATASAARPLVKIKNEEQAAVEMSAIFDRYRESMAASEKPEIDRQRSAWAEIAAALRLHTAYPTIPLPKDVAQDLGTLIDTALTGTLPVPIATLIKGDASSPGARIRRNIETAILYVNAATHKTQGFVYDRSPVKTIRDAYGISEATYKEWRKVVNRSLTDPSRFQPENHPDVRATNLERLVRKSAESHRVLGQPDYPVESEE